MQAAVQSSSPDTITAVSLGCRLNAREAEIMRVRAREAGLSNTVIVNTCAVTNEAVRQSRQTIRALRRAHPDAELIVTGCAAQIDPQTFAAMPAVDRILGNEEKLRAASFDPARARVLVGDIMGVRAHTPHLSSALASRTRAYVEVQTGCDHRCTFCVIPYGRGNGRSAPAGDVVEHIRALARAGAPEVVLTGVDLTSWGEDLPGAPTLGGLVARILKFVPELKRLRLSSIDAVELDEQLFRLIVAEDRIAPHLHLSLQHGHDLILKRMKRRHGRADAIDLCARLKAARPEIALGADLIAGFPTESDEHFEASVSLVGACALSYVHVFPFSPRAGAPAARMPQLDRAVIKARAARLRAAAGRALCDHLDRWLGRTAEALIEHDGGAARLPDFTRVRAPQTMTQAGETVQLRFTGHDGRALHGVSE